MSRLPVIRLNRGASFVHHFVFCAAALFASSVCSVHAQSIVYDVFFKDQSVATQHIYLARDNGETMISASFAAVLPVFVSLHHIEEYLSVTYKTNGTVQRFHANLIDGPVRTEINAEVGADGTLRVVRSDQAGVATNFIRRADYDFNSMILYGTAPGDFIPTNTTARVLDVAQGRVVPMTLGTVSESYTFERQNLETVHIIWKDGTHTSHSWHPERFSNFPARYIRQSDSGEFTFSLIR